MSGYDALAGVDQPTLDHLSAQLYGAIYPLIFKGRLEIGQEPIHAVHYDATAAPRFDLTPAEGAAAALAEGVPLDPELVASVLEESALIPFGLFLPAVRLKVELKPGETIDLDATVRARCDADLQGGGRVVFQVRSARVGLPQNPELEELVNAYAVPLLLPRVNEALAKGWQVPSLQFYGASFSVPVVRTEGPVLVGYAALRERGATVPPERLPWPGGMEFVAFDDAVAETVTAEVMKPLRRSGEAYGEIPLIWPARLIVRAGFDVGVGSPRYAIQPDNVTHVGVEAFGGGWASLQIPPLPEVKVNLRLSATPTVLARMSIQAGRQLWFTYYLVQDFQVKIILDPIPRFITDVLSDVLSVLTKPIAQAIGLLLSGLTFPVHEIPEIPVDVDPQLRLLIDPADLQVTTVPDRGRNLAVAFGTVRVRRQVKLDVGAPVAAAAEEAEGAVAG
jgi:hypothetical protein